MTHPNARLEALCDGVFAIAMTLLVLDLRLPSPETLTSSMALWHALRHLAPEAFAFVLSFAVILITWVSHHGMLKLVHGTSARFIYANGVLLLAVVVMPFPASLLGAFLATDHSGPAVVLYNAVLAGTALGWILIGETVLRDGLVRGPVGQDTIERGRRHAWFALFLYTLLAVAAVWYPRLAASVTSLTWLFWLVSSIRLKHRELEPVAA